jgi:hypothetical protein
MTDTLITAAAALAATALLCATFLRAWRGWLELRRDAASPPPLAESDDVGVRIELAAVRERLRKLEAIASGVDL